MSDFPKTEKPEFSSSMKMLETADPAHADIFNRMFAILLQNDVFLQQSTAKKSIIHEIILLVSGWKGDTPPYQYDIEVPEADLSNNIEILPAGTPAPEEYNCIVNAGIFAGKQSAGTVTLYAYNEKPALDIPVIVLVRGD